MAGEEFQMFTLTWFVVTVLTAGNLLVYDGTTDVTNRVLVNESDDYLPVFNDVSLPSAIKGLSVGGPVSLKVSLYYTQHSGSLYQGVTFEWKSPTSGASQEGLKGFYVELDGKKSVNRYKLFILNNTGFEHKSLTFRMKMEKFSRMTDDFTVKVYSMPAQEKHRNNSNTFQYMYLRTIISNDNTFFNPDKWSPTIAYKPLWEPEKSVDVYFSLPREQDDWLSTQFNVMLLSCSDGKSVERHLVKNTTDAEAFLNFPQLKKDTPYSLVAEVQTYNNVTCDISCGFTQTKEFTLSENEHLSEHDLSRECELNRTTPTYPSKSQPSPTTESKSTPVTTPVETEDVSNGSNTVVVVIVVTVTLFVALVLAGLVIARHYYKKRKDNDQPTEKPHLLPNTDITGIPLENMKELHPKTVYIVAASDHEEANDLIKSFCAFLKAHCQCDVINSCDVNLRQIPESVWVTTKMSSSDCVIFMNSKGAGKLLDVYLNSTECDLDLPQSMTVKAFQFSFNSNLRSKFITVTFNQDWFRDKLAILNPKKYLLPKQLPHFLRGIHNLSERDAEKYEGQLPLNMKCLDNLPEWQPFSEAMRQMENFEKNNQPSCEAKDNNTTSSPLNGPLSVSTTDLSINTDIPEQPSTFSPCSESLRDPGYTNEVDQNNDGPSNIPFGPLDGLSCYTVGKVSDIQNSVNKEPIQSAFTDRQITTDLQSSQGAAEDRNLRPKVNTPAPPPLIIPPRDITKLPRDDSVSTVLSKWNDSLSVQSKQPSDGTIDQKENREKFEKSPNSVDQSRIIKPPPFFVPTDNISDCLQAFNEDNNSEFYRQLPQDKQDEICV